MNYGKRILGIDIGGTKIHMGVVQNGELLNNCIIPTPSASSMDQILSELVAAAESLMVENVAGIGVGVPGLVDEEKGMVYSLLNIPSWKEVPLKKHLEDHLNLPACIANDANSFAAGVKVYGQGGNYKNMLGLTLGTGLGTGIIIDNKIYSGNFSCAGEFGRIPYLGRTLEDYCSGKFFTEQFGLSGKRLNDLAEIGDSHALQIFSQYGYHLGNAIKIMVYALSPEAVFLGGSIAEGYQYYAQSVRDTLGNSPLHMVTTSVILEKSELKNAAILGAAAIFYINNFLSSHDLTFPS
ncbi:MAG TPA: ROK family protein [Anditalea sp.]|nr:ROK family protein [Anditalea sp.]